MAAVLQNLQIWSWSGCLDMSHYLPSWVQTWRKCRKFTKECALLYLHTHLASTQQEFSLKAIILTVAAKSIAMRKAQLTSSLTNVLLYSIPMARLGVPHAWYKESPGRHSPTRGSEIILESTQKDRKALCFTALGQALSPTMSHSSWAPQSQGVIKNRCPASAYKIHTGNEEIFGESFNW